MLITKALLFGLTLAVIDVIVFSMLKSYKIGGTIHSYFDVRVLLITAFIMYGTQALIFYKSLDSVEMVRTNLLWDLLSDILVTLVGLYVFKEYLSNTQKIGVILAFISISLLK